MEVINKKSQVYLRPCRTCMTESFRLEADNCLDKKLQADV